MLLCIRKTLNPYYFGSRCKKIISRDLAHNFYIQVPKDPKWLLLGNIVKNIQMWFVNSSCKLTQNFMSTYLRSSFQNIN